ncbi:MAG: hypothetical protein Q8R82_07145 [Hyphomonadaceae bacterium]|nr:hypothetical protein [Hyphomonadaceae bacterium]
MYPQAMEFARLFGAFEYAMKRGGLHCKGTKWKTGKPAAADWTTFVLMLPADFFAKASLLPQARHLIDHPPRKLVMGPEDGPPVWGDFPAASTDAAKLVDHLKDVRNNFFHGDKTATDRDVDLLVAGTAVLMLMRSMTVGQEALKAFHGKLNEMVGPMPLAAE